MYLRTVSWLEEGLVAGGVWREESVVWVDREGVNSRSCEVDGSDDMVMVRCCFNAVLVRGMVRLGSTGCEGAEVLRFRLRELPCLSDVAVLSSRNESPAGGSVWSIQAWTARLWNVEEDGFSSG